METNSKYIKKYQDCCNGNIKNMDDNKEWQHYADSPNIILFNNRINKHFGSKYKTNLIFQNQQFITSEGIYQFCALFHDVKLRSYFTNHHVPMFDKIFGNENYYNKNQKFWNMRFDCFVLSLMIKFKQDENLREILLKTKDKILIESVEWETKKDNGFFGCRFNPNTNTYDGFNLHGKILMQIRKYIQNNVFDEHYEKFIKYMDEEYFQKLK
jgi:predicted NAD-dependent protein-ADP-ribosyltransferase YbiA (DUF1768 family)